MNKFRRLQITLATVLCLIGGNKVSNSTVNAETPKSSQVSQHTQSKDAGAKTITMKRKIFSIICFVLGSIIGAVSWRTLLKGHL